MPDPIDEIRREVEGRTAHGDAPGRKPARRGRHNPATSPGSGRPRQPTASARASELGQLWYDLGNRNGFDFPYDANYFALALQRKIERDPEIKPFLDKGKHDQVSRWIRKMIEIWWAEGNEEGGGYLTNEIQPRNAKEYFLNTDWDDLRDYARTALRAIYLKQHGKKVPPPIYPDQQEYQARLDEIRRKAKINPYLRHVDEAPERPEVDPEGRQRLRSWREKRSKK